MEKQDLINELLNTKPSDAKKFIFKDVITYAKCYKVYDGDTITIIFKYNNEILSKACRIIGIDTPEMKGSKEEEKKLAIKAKEYLRDLVLNKIIKVEFLEFDKYGRPLIKLFTVDENYEDINNISDLMISGGYAKPYDGRTKDKW
jgi:endonuclease YncB( thermonuclease family)